MAGKGLMRSRLLLHNCLGGVVRIHDNLHALFILTDRLPLEVVPCHLAHLCAIIRLGLSDGIRTGVSQRPGEKICRDHHLVLVVACIHLLDRKAIGSQEVQHFAHAVIPIVFIKLIGQIILDLPLRHFLLMQNTQHAYGLFQQDPAAKYLKRPYAMALSTYAPNYADRAGQPHDGNAQVNYLHWICSDPNGGEWQSSGGWGAEYKMPYSDFITNSQEQTVAYLTHTFFYGYERGTWGENRVTAANYWYEYFSGHPPTPPQNNGAWYAVLHKVIRRRNSGLVLKRGMFNIK